MSELVHTTDLTRSYGETVALHETTLQIPAGQIVGLLGPNGAGKTTLINLLVGLRRPTSGTVQVCGGDPRQEATRTMIGVTPQETALPENWRAGELVDFIRAHFPDPLDRTEALARMDLTGLADRQIGGLSGGQQRRLAVALAFIGRPRIVFLDEPTTGLDVEARHGLWQGIGDYHAEGGTVVLTSHYLEEIEALAQRVVVLDHGRILTDGSLEEVRGLVRLKRVTLTDALLPDLTDAVLSELAGVHSVEHDGARTHLLTDDAVRLVHDLATTDTSFTDIEIRSASLEDAFLALTSRDPAG